ncbi:MAG: hypothetical protein RLZ35_627 [Pseudomonadota bacterium]
MYRNTTYFEYFRSLIRPTVTTSNVDTRVEDVGITHANTLPKNTLSLLDNAPLEPDSDSDTNSQSESGFESQLLRMELMGRTSCRIL